MTLLAPAAAALPQQLPAARTRSWLVPTIFVHFGGGSGRSFCSILTPQTIGRMVCFRMAGILKADQICHFLSFFLFSWYQHQQQHPVLLRTWSRLIECVVEAAAAAVYPFQEQRFFLRLFLFCPSFKRNCSVHYFYCYCCLHLLR